MKKKNNLNNRILHFFENSNSQESAEITPLNQKQAKLLYLHWKLLCAIEVYQKAVEFYNSVADEINTELGAENPE